MTTTVKTRTPNSIEEMFISEYQRVSDRNRELESENSRLSSKLESRDCTIERGEFELVNVRWCGDYDLMRSSSSIMGHMTEEELRGFLSKPYGDRLEFLMETRAEKDYRSRIVSNERKRFSHFIVIDANEVPIELYWRRTEEKSITVPIGPEKIDSVADWDDLKSFHVKPEMLDEVNEKIVSHVTCRVIDKVKDLAEEREREEERKRKEAEEEEE